MKKIGFIDYESMDEIAEDELYLIPIFKQLDVEIEHVVWDDALVDWKSFDFFVFRSTWDYFKKVERFEKFLQYIEDNAIKTYNSIATIKKNANKNYLLEFEKNGVTICPTVIIPKGKFIDLKGIMLQSGWDSCVVKPTVSGGAFHTYRIKKEEADAFQIKLNQLKDAYTFMLQPYFSEIETSGERSLIYFNKIFSHAMVKQVNEGDFRVQKNFGGTMQTYIPTTDDLIFADHVLSQIQEELLYARVDFIESKGQLILMELELFEPALYLTTEEAKANFANALKSKL